MIKEVGVLQNKCPCTLALLLMAPKNKTPHIWALLLAALPMNEMVNAKKSKTPRIWALLLVALPTNEMVNVPKSKTPHIWAMLLVALPMDKIISVMFFVTDSCFSP